MSTTRRIYNTIKNEIFTGKIKCGEYVLETTLAEQFNVSRTPIREALKLIESTGIIYKESNGRFRVITLTESFVEEHFSLRIVIKNEMLKKIFKDDSNRAYFSEMKVFFSNVEGCLAKKESIQQVLEEMRTFIYDYADLKSISNIMHDFNLLINMVAFGDCDSDEYNKLLMDDVELYRQLFDKALSGLYKEALLLNELIILNTKQAVLRELRKQQ